MTHQGFFLMRLFYWPMPNALALVFLIAGLWLTPQRAFSITLTEAEEVIDSVFTRNFQNHHLHHVLFFDGTTTRVAYAAARSGPVSSGGCGFTLTLPSIGITFDTLTDSTGAEDEGMRVFIIRPANYPTKDSARNMLEMFLYENITGTAGLVENHSPLHFRYVNSNPAREVLWIAGEKGSQFTVVNVLGQIVFTHRFHKTEIYPWRLSALASGCYFYQLSRPHRSVSGQFIRLRP